MHFFFFSGTIGTIFSYIDSGYFETGKGGGISSCKIGASFMY